LPILQLQDFHSYLKGDAATRTPFSADVFEIAFPEADAALLNAALLIWLDL